MKLSRSQRIRLANLWPPFLGLGIRLALAPDRLSIRSTMRLRFWNRNIVGTAFGGGIYAMVDPICMIVLMENLGPDYVVWDKAATVRFRRPGRSDLTAEFRLTPEEIATIRTAADTQDRIEPAFTVQVRDADGQLVAEMEKLLFVQRKALFQEQRANR